MSQAATTPSISLFWALHPSSALSSVRGLGVTTFVGPETLEPSAPRSRTDSDGPVYTLRPGKTVPTVRGAAQYVPKASMSTTKSKLGDSTTLSAFSAGTAWTTARKITSITVGAGIKLTPKIFSFNLN